MKHLHLTVFSTLFFAIASTAVSLSGPHPAPVEVSIRVSEQVKNLDHAYYGEVNVKFYQDGRHMTEVVKGPYENVWLRGFDLTKAVCTDSEAANNPRLVKNQCQIPGSRPDRDLDNAQSRTHQEKPYRP